MNHMFYFVLVLAVVSVADAGPVLDIDGNIIFRGSYYVLPVLRGRGGGLTLAAGRGNKVCPFDIVQESKEVNKGLPVKFSNWRSRVGFVPESEDLNIETDLETEICGQSYWKVDKLDRERNQFFVVAGPKPERDGRDSINSFFRIEKVGDIAYKFVFCPGKLTCRNVGIFVDEKGVRRLALSSTPFLVMFKKANVIELPTKNM